jgi:acyl-CoA dehydrogenase
MAISFEVDAEVRALAERTHRFVRDEVIPCEGEACRGPTEELRTRLQERARAAGLLAPHVGEEFGGHGLDLRGQAVVFEEAGYSLLGPLGLNCSAPDEGNMHLLEVVATPEQRERFLTPLARGDVRSCFAMTEPAPGAGSDPRMLRTEAKRADGGWVVNGHKWYITGADGAGFAIVMARTAPEITGSHGATMFLVAMSEPGIRVKRHIPSLDEGFIGGHCEVMLEDLFVPDGDVLGDVDRGYHYAQVRLNPARLTHCMRWLGLARHAQDIAVDRATEREAFGSRLADLGLVQQLLSDSEIDIAASRALIARAAWDLDASGKTPESTAVAKVFVAEAVHRVVDRAMQVCGSLGVSADLPLGRFLREVRPFRIYDGPSEVHRWSLARRRVKAGSGEALPGWR